MDTALLAPICSLLGAVIVGLFTYLAGKNSKKIGELEEKLTRRNVELLAVYQDLGTLVSMKEKYIDVTSTTKQNVNKEFPTSKKCYPSNIKSRIEDLQNQLLIIND